MNQKKIRTRCKHCNDITSSAGHEDLCKLLSPNIEVRKNSWACKICTFESNAKSGLFRHMSSKHRGELSFSYKKVDGTSDSYVIVDTKMTEKNFAMVKYEPEGKDKRDLRSIK